MGMAARRILSAKSRNPWAFMTVLSSAACEWFLLVMLLVDAALSYLLTKFAQYCDLQTPCLLCSRIEHVFGKNKHGYYWSLLCFNHREEISSSVYCHIHNKPADLHALCPDCLMSFSRMSKSNSESCRLLVAKLGIDIEESRLKSLLLNKRFVADSSGPRNCSCCNRLLKAKSSAQTLLQVTPVGNGASKANVKPPLPRVPGRSRFSRRDGLKRIKEKLSGPMAPHPELKISSGVDSLSHVAYTELKISSDTESDFPFSDDDDVASVRHGSNDSRTESDIQHDLQKLPKVLSDKSSPRSQNHRTFEPFPSLFDQSVQLESSAINLEPLAFEKDGLQESKWAQPNEKPSSSGLSELVSLDDVLQVPENPKSSASVPQPSNLSLLSELLSLSNVLSSSNVAKIAEKSDLGPKEDGSITAANAHSLATSNSMDSTITFTDTNKERMESGLLANPHRTNGSGTGDEALNSPPRISSSDMNISPRASSPRVGGNHDGLQRSDVLSSDAVDMVQLGAALERHDAGHESTDGINVKEIEGETILDRLSRQTEYDKRCMKALFKELEEERGAAAIAANQTMAMITRLQEEKAALHMEALQYLRMMEEQAEYDMEALEKANDLLSEREKEIQDLEAELEIYRNNILDEPSVDDPHRGTSNENVESKTGNNFRTANLQNGSTAADDPKPSHTLKDSLKHENLSSPELDFEDEKLYLSQSLERLEKKFHQIYGNEAIMDMANGQCSEKLIRGVDDAEELADDIETQIKHHNGENGLTFQKDLGASNGKSRKDMCSDLVEHNHVDYEESGHLDAVQDRIFADGDGRKLDTYKDNINNLKKRLEALETNYDILAHALNSLHSGNDGLQFIQEIAHQLEELRKIEFHKSMAGDERETSDES